MRWVCSEEYGYFLNEGGVFIERDLTQVPTLQKRILSQSQAARSRWDMGMPANQAFRMVGLRVSSIPTSEVSFVGGQPKIDEEGDVLAAEQRLATPKKTPAQTDEADNDGAANEDDKGTPRSGLQRSAASTRKGWTEDKKSWLWKAADDLATSRRCLWRGGCHGA